MALTSISFLHNSKLRTIHPGTFDNLPNVIGIEIRTSPLLAKVSLGVFGSIPLLSSLSFQRCGLESVPDFTTLQLNGKILTLLDLSYNKIYILKSHTFNGLPFEIYKLDLSNNKINSVAGGAFEGANIYMLILSSNYINYMDDDAFKGIEGLKDVSLADTGISKLPTLGLKNIISLNIKGTPNLKHFPPLFKFHSIQNVKVHYFSHCCAFLYNTTENEHMANMYNITDPVENQTCPTTPNPSTDQDDRREASIPWSNFALLDDGGDDDEIGRGSSLSKTGLIFTGSSIHQLPSNISLFPNDPSIGVQTGSSQDINSLDHGVFSQQTINPNSTHRTQGDSCGNYVPKNYSSVNCLPGPDAFNPCTDVMGYSFLRVAVWVIASTAIVGNLVVVIVLVAYRHKMTVPKFLMCNLAFADFCMGIYLFMVASVDLHTHGEYFNYAIDWQFGAGCKIAGFISIFSSELSVFTLTVLTIERWYTIIYAIDLNKRIRLRQASRILLGGWFFSVVVASLPFFGISGYGITSMCLPFYVRKEDGLAAAAYVIFILLFNALAFIIICACYIKMYVTVRNPHSAMQRKDSKVAKRMAVLIFTDLACWAPIAINGLSMIFLHEKSGLLTTNQSKFLIVLFYPINSCANPFLYAIFTRAFRRDMFLLLAKHGMCERRAMKYRPTCTSSPRSMSQVNSTTMRDVGLKGSHRGSSASVMTQITSEARLSTVSHDKDSPDNSPKTNIELQLVVTVGTNPLQTHIPVDSGQNQLDSQSVAPNTITKPAGNKKLNEYLYLVDGLPPVPEEHNVDHLEIASCSHFEEEGKTGGHQPINGGKMGPKMVKPHEANEDDSGNPENSLLLPQAETSSAESSSKRKNSPSDSGIQSDTTTPTDRDVTSNVMQTTFAKPDDFETTL